MTASVLILAAVIAGPGLNAAPDDAAADEVRTVSIDSIREGYGRNREAFNYLHVVWRRRMQNGPGTTRQLDFSKAYLESGLREGTLPEQIRASAQSDIEYIASSRDDPFRLQPHVFVQEFFTDRSGFQIRYPNALGMGTATPVDFVFPPQPVTPDSLPELFGNIHVGHFSGRKDEGFQVWAPSSQADRRGVVVSTVEAFADLAFPPLALVDTTSVSPDCLHPSDRFMTGLDDSFQVLGPAIIQDRETILIERAVEAESKDQFLLPAQVQDYGDRARYFRVTRAWIDMARGCLPLRIETSARYLFDGREIDDPFAINPISVFEIAAVERVEGGGFYPMKVSETSYETDSSVLAKLSIVNVVLEGADAKSERMIFEEKQQEVLHVDANPNEALWRRFALPDETRFADGRTKTSHFIGKGGVVERLESRPAAAPSAGMTTMQLGTAVLGVLLLLGIVIALFVRFRRS